MRILRFRCRLGNAFAANRNQDSRIVRLVADRIRFAILDPKVGPVIVDLKCEGRFLDFRFAANILRDIKTCFFSA